MPLTFAPTGPLSTNIATDPVTGALYVQESVFGDEIGGGHIRRFLSDGAPTPTYTEDPSFAPTPSGGFLFVSKAGLAVNPTNHEVVAFAFGQAELERLDPATGALISTIGLAGNGSNDVAVGPDGTIYVSVHNEILRFTSTGTPLSSFPLKGDVSALGVNLVTGNVVAILLGPQDLQVLEFSPAGERLSDRRFPKNTLGVAISPAGDRLYSYNPSTTSIDTYIKAPYPGVGVPVASELTTTGFHISAELDPGEEEGSLPAGSKVRFEYRLKSDEDWTPTPDQDVTAAGSYADNITGLEPNRTYEVRAVGSNALALSASDPAKVTTLGIPPAVDTSAATDVTETGAVLNGIVNPFGAQTTYHFEYGATTAYGARIPAGIDAVAGNNYGPKKFSRRLFGLAPGTTYHFRLVATNATGTTEGQDRTFTTITAGGEPVFAYEQVTPADKQGAAVIPRLGMQAAPDGNGISYTTKTGSQSSPLVVRSVAIRGASDWQGRIDTDPPLNAASHFFLAHATLAVSTDFTHTFVVSNRALTPGAIEGGGNLYRVEVGSDDYQFIGANGEEEAFPSFASGKQNNTFMAGAPDLGWIVFTSPLPLLPGAPNHANYRWSEADGLELVSVTPNGDPSEALKGAPSSLYHTVSDDGGRIYFTATSGSERGVYLREDGGAALPISVSHVPGDPATAQPGVLLEVNKDGRYAFFASKAKLTDDAPEEPAIEPPDNLYRYDASDGSLEYLGVQVGITSTQANEVTGGSFGTGADGRTFYFNAAASGLHVWHDGTVNAVTPAALAAGEERSSPSGQYFAFYEGGAIRVYDAESNEVSCASCLPDGTPVAATLPETDELYVSNRYPQAVTDDGTVYFGTATRMVAADVNGTRDVYAYRDGSVRLISPGNRSFEASIADISEDGSNVFFTTAQKLVGRDNDESIDVYVARLNGGLPVQNPPPAQECLRDDCKATPGAGPELPFGGSEALSGPENVKPKKKVVCGKGKRKVKVNGKAKCVKKHKAGKSRKGGNR